MSRHVSLSMPTLQRVDQRLGWVLCAALQPLRWLRLPGLLLPQRRASGRVLLLKFWGIGSLQLMTPAVRSLRRRHPDAELVLLTLASNRDVAEALGVFDRVLTLDVDTPGWTRILARIVRCVAALRGERFDSVYDFEFFTRFSALVTLATGSRDTHGYATSKVWRGAFHHREVPFNRYWHVARNFRVLAGDEDGREVTAAEVDALRFGTAAEGRVEGLLAAAGLPAGMPYAVLDPNAGTLSLERRWPVARFGELASRLAREDRLGVVLIGSRSERDYTEQVRTLADPEAVAAIVNLAGDLDARALAALLARATLVVSNDSGPMHLAAALGAPTVGLFGPETPVMYAPLGRSARALYQPTPCSPCINVHDNKFSSCVFGHPHCLVQIEVDAVLAAARRTAGLLGHPRRETAPDPLDLPAPLPHRSRRF